MENKILEKNTRKIKNFKKQKLKEIKTNKSVIIVVILLLIFIIMAILIVNGKTVEFDKIITNYITTIPESFNKILEVITNIGGIRVLPIIGIVTCISLIIVKKRKYGILILSNLVCTTVIYTIIKNIVQRPRPEIFRFIEETGYSFPSGHSANNIAFYGLIIYLICKNIKNKPIKIILSSFIVVWIIAIGVSRIYFNVHYPTDVICGYILGIIVTILSVNIFSKLEKSEKI